MLDDIYVRTPVNKQAKVVVSQSGCEDEMSLADQRDCLARSLLHLEREINGLPKKHPYRAELGRKKLQLQNEISVVNKAIKQSNIRGVVLDKYIIAECKRRMSKAQWYEILCAARAAKEIDFSAQEQAA